MQLAVPSYFLTNRCGKLPQHRPGAREGNRNSFPGLRLLPLHAGIPFPSRSWRI